MPGDGRVRPKAAADNTLTAAEKAAGWQLLFDGKTLTGGAATTEQPPAGWTVVDGELTARARAATS